MAQPRSEARQPDYGPSLPELLRPRLRALAGWQRIVGGLCVALLLAAVAALVIRHEAANKTYTETAADARKRGLEPFPFHFDYSRKLRISKPAGSYVQAERRIDGTLAARLRVSPFPLRAQSGLVSGFIPIVASGFERQAARTYNHLRLQFEGRARVNEVEGYQFAFTARLIRPGLPPRQLFGRTVILPEPFDPSNPGTPYPPGKSAKRGLLIAMLATTLDSVPSATRVGDQGTLRRPFRSFRFGT